MLLGGMFYNVVLSDYSFSTYFTMILLDGQTKSWIVKKGAMCPIIQRMLELDITSSTTCDFSFGFNYWELINLKTKCTF